MSTILRALQRLEGEKRGDGERGGLSEGLVPSGEPLVRPGRAGWRIGITAFFALLLLGFFLWWLIPIGEVGEVGEVGRPSEELPPAIAAQPKPRPEPLAQPARRSPPKPEAEIAAARSGAPAEQVGVLRPSQPLAAPPPQVAELPPPPAAELAIQPPPRIAEPPALPEQVAVAPPPPPPVAEPAPVERVAELPPPPVAQPAIQPPPPIARPPVAKTPTPARVATVQPPKLTVKKTIWHPTPERRMAQIEVEGRKGLLELHEGDAVGTLVVSEIQPSGVVFLHGGERIHQKVGSGR